MSLVHVFDWIVVAVAFAAIAVGARVNGRALGRTLRSAETQPMFGKVATRAADPRRYWLAVWLQIAGLFLSTLFLALIADLALMAALKP